MKNVATQVDLLQMIGTPLETTPKGSSEVLFERPSDIPNVRPSETPSAVSPFEASSESPSETSLQTPVVDVSHQYYVGPAMISTQPLPPLADFVIASGFSFPPPPLPEYYVGPVLFHTSQPPPLPCCVVASGFSYPPPLPEYLLPRSGMLDFPPPRFMEADSSELVRREC